MVRLSVQPARLHRILCVSADIVRQRAFVAALAGPGRAVECVRDSGEALACLEKYPGCDCFVTVDTLPDGGGLALVRRLRHAGFAGSVVVTCTAATAAVVAAYRGLGVRTLLLEPAPAALMRTACLGEALSD